MERINTGVPQFETLSQRSASLLPDESIWATADEFRTFTPKPVTFKPMGLEKFLEFVDKYKLRTLKSHLFCTAYGVEYLHKDLIPIIKNLLHLDTPLKKFREIQGHPCETAGRKPCLSDYEAIVDEVKTDD